MQMSNIYARYLRRHGGQNGCKHQLESVRETCVWHPWGPPARQVQRFDCNYGSAVIAQLQTCS